MTWLALFGIASGSFSVSAGANRHIQPVRRYGDLRPNYWALPKNRSLTPSVSLKPGRREYGRSFDKTMSFKLPIALRPETVSSRLYWPEKGLSESMSLSLDSRIFCLLCVTQYRSVLAKDIGERYYADCVIKPLFRLPGEPCLYDCALDLAAGGISVPVDVARDSIHSSDGLVEGFCGQPFVQGETPR